jgi:hypothetical protein
VKNARSRQNSYSLVFMFEGRHGTHEAVHACTGCVQNKLTVHRHAHRNNGGISKPDSKIAAHVSLLLTAALNRDSGTS